MNALIKQLSLLDAFNRWREGKLEAPIQALLGWCGQKYPGGQEKFKEAWLRQEFFNLPNSLSLIRLLSIVPLLGLLHWQDYWGYLPALIFFVLMALTDLLDGTIARAAKCQTECGSFIDGLADKVLIVLAMAVQNHHHQILLAELIWATAVGEIFYCAMRLWQLKIKFKSYGSTPLGKIKFFLQVAVVVILLAKWPWALYANLILAASLICLYFNITMGLWLIAKRFLAPNHATPLKT